MMLEDMMILLGVVAVLGQCSFIVIKVDMHRANLYRIRKVRFHEQW